MLREETFFISRWLLSEKGENRIFRMADGAVDLDALRAQIAKKGGDVRQLKKDGAPKEDIMKEVAALKELRAQLEALAVDGGAEKWKIDIAALEDLLKRRMFICPAFEIYRGVAGLYDFGPPGCGLKVSSSRKFCMLN